MAKITSEEKLKAIAEENALYLRHLRNTGNGSLAARFAKRSRKTFTSRRCADPEFDGQCAAAIAFGSAAVSAKGRRRAGGSGSLTTGGEYIVAPNQAGTMQVRRARPGFVTRRGEEAFLTALAATANIQLSAQAVGVSASVFYKRRARSEEFARRMQDALAAGYEAVEFALVSTALRTLAPEGLAPEPLEPGEADPGPIAPGARMSVDQAMTLIAQRTKAMAIGERHANDMVRKPATREETNAAILKKLRVMERQQREEEEREREREQKLLSDGRE